MIITKTVKAYFSRTGFLLTLVAAFGITLLLPLGNAYAAGDASFALSPGSGSYSVGSTISVQITETSSSSDNIYAAGANLSYPTSLLQFDSSTVNGPFNSIVLKNSAASGVVNIALASYTAVNGPQAQNVADVTFTVLASGSTSTSSSSPNYLGLVASNNGTTTDLDNSGGSSVWNGSLPGVAYTLTQPASSGGTTSSGGGTSGSTSGGTTSSGSTTKSTSSSSKASTSTAAPATPASGTSTPVTVPSNTPTTTSTTPVISSSSISSLSVTVTNSQDKPVVGAKVTLSNGQSGKTNSYGVVSFSGIPAGKYKATITSPGKKPVTSSVNVGTGQNKQVAYKLASNKLFTGNEIAIDVLIIAILAIGFIIFRRIRSGFIPEFSGNNGVIVGGIATPTVSPPNPVENTTDTSQTITVKSVPDKTSVSPEDSSEPNVIFPGNQDTPK